MAAYRFGPFLLDTARRVLLRDAAAVDLPPKAFDVIVYLLEHRERAVGRDELIAGVWGRVDVSDNVLDQVVLRARKALGDVADPRRYIATRPRFGFAWVGDIDPGDRIAPATAPSPTTAQPAASAESPTPVPMQPVASAAAPTLVPVQPGASVAAPTPVPVQPVAPVAAQTPVPVQPGASAAAPTPVLEQRVASAAVQTPAPEQRVAIAAAQSPVPEYPVPSAAAQPPVSELSVASAAVQTPLPAQSVASPATQTRVPAQRVATTAAQAPVQQEPVASDAMQTPLPAQSVAASAAPSRVPAPPVANPLVRRALWIRAWLAIAAVVVFSAWWLQRDVVPVSARDAVLVLPLEVAPQADAAWARLGLMDLVAQRLREAGLDTLPSDHAVALLRGDEAPPADASGLRALATRADAAYVVAGEVAFAAGRWTVRLRASGRQEESVEASGEATHALDAARQAADALASALGRVPPGVALPGDPALALQLQQIDAAVLGDALDTARRLLDAMTPAQRAEPAVRLRAATLHFRRGELDDAARAFEDLLAEVSASDDPRLRGTVLNALGNLALRRNDPAAAERRGEEAIALLATLPPSRELGRAWTGRAIARSTLQRHDEALADFARARLVLDGVDDRLGVARVDINVGILDVHRGRYAEAVPALAAAADRLAAFNDLTNELYARVALVRARLGLLEPAAALADARRLGELVAREPNPERRRYAELARVEAAWANGREADAEALLQAVRQQAGADADVVLLGWAQALAARHALATDPAQAERDAEAALNAPWEEEGSRFFAEAWLTLVRARLALPGDAGGEGVAAALQGFETWARRKNDVAVEPALALARAEVAARREPPAAGAAYARAIAAAETSRIPAEWLRAAASHAAWSLQQGDAAQAAAVAGRAGAFAGRDFDAAVLAARLHAALGQAQAARAALEQARPLAGERPVPTVDELATR